jgi:predicted phage tail protein
MRRTFMSAQVLRIRPKPEPVLRHDLEALTKRSLQLNELRKKLEKSWEQLREAEAEVEKEKLILLARLAEGAELDED